MSDIVRKAVSELAVHELVATEDSIDTVVSYFNRQQDISLVRASIKTRYGYGIKQTDNPADPDRPLETYEKENFHEQVDAGMVDSITIGFGQKMTNALATLFTESGLKFTLQHESVDDVSKADELLDHHREEGSFLSAMTKADQKAVQCGSAAIMPRFRRGLMSYDVLAPSDVRAFFEDTLTEEGEERSTDKTDIEDASVVTIRLSRVDNATWRYLAIFGASDLYPMGRWVEYESSNLSAEIPELHAEGTIEYEIDGVGPCNPLTYWAELNPELDLPEYPIAIIDGGLTESSDCMPVSTSLYECCLKFDEKASHLLSTSQDAARGLTVISRGHEGKTAALPRVVTGATVLDVGLTADHISKDSTASVDALSVLKDEMTQLASGYGVPAYMVVEEDSAFMQASSGIALQVKTRQLKKARKKRANDNRPPVKKIFNIEKAYLGLYAEDDQAAISLLQDCTQKWDPGELKLPRNMTEVMEEIKAAKEQGIMDEIASIRAYYDYATDDEAIKHYEKMRDRQGEYPPLKKEEEPPMQKGLLRRGEQPLKAVK